MRARIQLKIPGPSVDWASTTRVVQELKDSAWSVDSASDLTHEGVSALFKQASEPISLSVELSDPNSKAVEDLVNKLLGSDHSNSDEEIQSMQSILSQMSTGDPEWILIKYCISAMASAPEVFEQKTHFALLHSSEYMVYGFAVWIKNVIRIDLESNESETLKEASQDLVSVIAKILEQLQVQVDRSREDIFRDVEVYAGDKRVLEGKVTYYSGRFALTKSIVFSGPALIYYGLGSVLLFLSGLLHFKFNLEAAARWFDDLTGALATSFFGAALVESAIRYNRIRGDSPEGRKSGITMIRWQSELVRQY